MEAFWKILKNTLVAAGLVTALVAGLLIYFVGDNIENGVTAVLERTSIGMPDDKIRLASNIAVLVFTFPIVWAMFTFWKNKVVLILIGSGSILGMMAFYHFTEEEMFGEGKEARFLCDSPVPTDPPFPHRSKKNPRMKGDCEEVTDPVQIAVAIMIMRAQKGGDPSKAEPRVLTLEEIADPKLELYKNKTPLIYMSKMEDRNGLRQMRAGPWFDGFSPGTMVPATWVAIEKIRKYVTDKEAAEAEAKQRKVAEAAKAKADAEKAILDKAKEKDKLYWRKRYADTVTSMNLEARKISIGGMTEREIKDAELMYLNLNSTLDEAKLMLSESERPKIRLEPLPSARKSETRAATITSPPPTDDELVMIVRLINRDPPKKFFEYEVGLRGNTVDSKSAGIYIQSLLQQCGKATLSVDNEEPTDLCKIHNQWVKVPPGSVYKINNLTRRTVRASVIRH